MMIYKDIHRFVMSSCASCVALFLLIVGCGRTVAPATITETPLLPTPTSSPTLCPTPPPCYTNRDFPPICNIIPGESTFENVEQIMGAPMFTDTVDVDQGVDLPAGTGIDMRGVPCGSFLDLYFANDVVYDVYYLFTQPKYLWQVVDMYGPPDKVQVIWIDPVEADPGGYQAVDFIWPAQGVLMVALLPEAIEHPREALPFQADLRILGVYYFQPTDLEEIVSTYHDGEVLIDWTGMTE